jgi:hypothetical protein
MALPLADSAHRAACNGAPLTKAIRCRELEAIMPDRIAELISQNKYEPKPAILPTSHRPGTRGKVLTMAARIAAGEELWHPADATLFSDESEFDNYIRELEELNREHSGDLPREEI